MPVCCCCCCRSVAAAADTDDIVAVISSGCAAWSTVGGRRSPPLVCLAKVKHEPCVACYMHVRNRDPSMPLPYSSVMWPLLLLLHLQKVRPWLIFPLVVCVSVCLCVSVCVSPLAVDKVVLACVPPCACVCGLGCVCVCFVAAEPNLTQHLSNRKMPAATLLSLCKRSANRVAASPPHTTLMTFDLGLLCGRQQQRVLAK